MKYWYCCILVLLKVIIGFSNLQGQANPLASNRLNAPKSFVYEREWNVDMRLKSDGFGIGFQTAKYKTYYKLFGTYFHFETHKHPKETRQNYKIVNPATGESSTSFIYGKINSFNSLRVGKFVKRYWSDKANHRGVLVGYVLGGGLTMGFLKPYYIKAAEIDPETGQAVINEIKYTEEGKDEFLDANRIFGRASFNKGLWETKIVPGVNVTAAAHFDFGKYDQMIKAIEIGFLGQFFVQTIDIMANQPSKPYMANLYLSLQFGKRIEL